MFVLTSRRERARARERESFIRKLFYNGGSRASPAGVRITIGFYKTSTHPECTVGKILLLSKTAQICAAPQAKQFFLSLSTDHGPLTAVRQSIIEHAGPRCAAVVPPAQNPPAAPAEGGVLAAVVSPAQRCSLHLRVDLY